MNLLFRPVKMLLSSSSSTSDSSHSKHDQPQNFNFEAATDSSYAKPNPSEDFSTTTEAAGTLLTNNISCSAGNTTQNHPSVSQNVPTTNEVENSSEPSQSEDTENKFKTYSDNLLFQRFLSMFYWPAICATRKVNWLFKFLVLIIYIRC